MSKWKQFTIEETTNIIFGLTKSEKNCITNELGVVGHSLFFCAFTLFFLPILFLKSLLNINTFFQLSFNKKKM